MAIIWCNVAPSVNGGGPSVFAHRIITALNKMGHKVISDKPQRADVALCIINTSKAIGRAKRVVLRIDGIFNKLYNEKFNRAIRPDMIGLHNELKRDVPLVDHMVYQSQWSKDRIDDEIVVRDKDYSIIHNAVDPAIFQSVKKDNSVLNLIHVGRMRDDYLMKMLIGVYDEVIKRGRKTKLILVGGMDGPCANVYKANRKGKNIVHMAAVPNHKLARVYAQGHIFLDARQGASSNNVVAESQACGLPVITPQWGGSQEMVVNKQTGMVVESGKWDYDNAYIQKLTDGVEYVMDNYSAMSLAARQHALDNLTVDQMVKKYIKVLGI